MHSAPRGLIARGLRKGGAEHRNGWNPAPLQLHGIGDADRSRCSAIPEALHDGIALGERRHIRFTEVILGRAFANDRSGHRGEPGNQLVPDAGNKKIRVELAVVHEPQALAGETGEPRRGGHGRGLVNGDWHQSRGH